MSQAEFTATRMSSAAVMPVPERVERSAALGYSHAERSAPFGPPPRRRTSYFRAALLFICAWAFALLNILSGHP